MKLQCDLFRENDRLLVLSEITEGGELKDQC